MGYQVDAVTMTADFIYHIKDDVLVIIDLNLGGKSVTNDIENVLRKIILEQGTAGNWRPDLSLVPEVIIYRDSEGFYDGVRIHANGSVSFYGTGSLEDEDAAIRMAKAMYARMVLVENATPPV